MTRIVGGVAGGRPLAVPGRGTRPTSDRVREALFSTLDSLLDLTGARVLDLFAGSGAVGLECASRGAAEVTLVESDRDAAVVARRNATSLGPLGADGLATIDVRQQRVEDFLADGAAMPAEPYGLVFADPPYAVSASAVAKVLEQLTVSTVSTRWLADRAIVVVERSLKSGPVPWPILIRPVKDRRYGDTVLWYGQRE